jgi:hypothetical protein
MNYIEAIKLLIRAKELGITDEQVAMIKQQADEIPQIEITEPVVPFNLDEMTEDEILYYSTPYYDELQERKLLQQQKNEEQV